MNDIDVAWQLQRAGLVWNPAELDMFALAVPDMGQELFVLSKFTAVVQLLNGTPAVTFHGSSEWALDYIFLSEVVWVPSESQIRAELEARLTSGQPGEFRLERTADAYVCTVQLGNQTHAFSGGSAFQCYAQVVLHLLQAA